MKWAWIGLVVAVLAAAAAGGFYIWHGRVAVAPAHTVVAPPPVPAVAAKAPPKDCLLPGPPPVPPDGASAKADDMTLGHDVIQGFVNQLERYQACRNDQIDHTPGISLRQKQQWIDDGDAAIDEANQLAAAFSEQLKIFKARGSPK